MELEYIFEPGEYAEDRRFEASPNDVQNLCRLIEKKPTLSLMNASISSIAKSLMIQLIRSERVMGPNTEDPLVAINMRKYPFMTTLASDIPSKTKLSVQKIMPHYFAVEEEKRPFIIQIPDLVFSKDVNTKLVGFEAYDELQRVLSIPESIAFKHPYTIKFVRGDKFCFLNHKSWNPMNLLRFVYMDRVFNKVSFEFTGEAKFTMDDLAEVIYRIFKDKENNDTVEKAISSFFSLAMSKIIHRSFNEERDVSLSRDLSKFVKMNDNFGSGVVLTQSSYAINQLLKQNDVDKVGVHIPKVKVNDLKPLDGELTDENFGKYIVEVVLPKTFDHPEVFELINPDHAFPTICLEKRIVTLKSDSFYIPLLLAKIKI